jgi:hypothetical protein
MTSKCQTCHKSLKAHRVERVKVSEYQARYDYFCEDGSPMTMAPAKARKPRSCRVCGVTLADLITYEDRAEHSANCYGRSIPLPARYG